MARIIQIKSLFILLLLLGLTMTPVYAFYVANNTDKEKEFEEMKQQMIDYEANLGISADEDGLAGGFKEEEVPSWITEAKMEMKDERASIIKAKKEREAAEKAAMEKRVREIQEQIALVESNQLQQNLAAEGRSVFVFQMSFLLGCLIVLFPFVYKKGKLLKFLNN